MGRPVRLTVRTSWVTTSCMCAYTTRDNGWSCSNHLHCESEYDLGGDNPVECTEVGSDVVVQTIPAPLEPPAEECSVETEPGSDTVDVVVRCARARDVVVDLHISTDRGDVETARRVVFSEPGVCLSKVTERPDGG